MSKEIRKIQLKAAQTRYVLKIQALAAEILANHPWPINLALVAALTGYASYRLERLYQLRVRRALQRLPR